MRIATIQVKGLTPYSQSRALQSTKKQDETHDDFDKRIWREHMHVNAQGEAVIPPVPITQGMAAAASYLGKGGGLKKKASATWAQNFTCGLAVGQSPSLGKEATDAVKAEPVYCHADGRRGSGKRVWRTFPLFQEWATTFVIHILDDSIPEDIFRRVAEAFGLFIGIGRYRPENGGYLGRFVIEKLEIKKA